MKPILNSFGLVLSLALVISVSYTNGNPNSVKGFDLIKSLHKSNSKELKNNIQVLLNYAKIRHVSTAKRRSQQRLASLYKEEKELKVSIEELKKNLGIISKNMQRQNQRSIEIQVSKADPNANQLGNVKVSELTTSKLESWTTELADKESQLNLIRAKIHEAECIVKNPENYIMVPINYGLNPTEFRMKERELIAQDRENMNYRGGIVSGEIEPPRFITDKF